MTQPVKGWSEEGIARFNALFDQVIADRARNPNFERKWLEARKSAQEEEGITEKKRKGQLTQARSEQLESDDGMTLHQPHLRRRWRILEVTLTKKQIR
jgi:hypothetical protein